MAEIAIDRLPIHKPTGTGIGPIESVGTRNCAASSCDASAGRIATIDRRG